MTVIPLIVKVPCLQEVEGVHAPLLFDGISILEAGFEAAVQPRNHFQETKLSPCSSKASVYLFFGKFPVLAFLSF